MTAVNVEQLCEFLDVPIIKNHILRKKNNTVSSEK